MSVGDGPEQSIEKSIQSIAESVESLSVTTKYLVDRQKVVNWVALAAGLVFSVVIAMSVANVRATQRLQERTSSLVLCPLYDRLLDSYNPGSPSAVADPVQYEESIRTIETGASILGCAHATRGIG